MSIIIERKNQHLMFLKAEKNLGAIDLSRRQSCVSWGGIIRRNLWTSACQIDGEAHFIFFCENYKKNFCQFKEEFINFILSKWHRIIAASQTRLKTLRCITKLATFFHSHKSAKLMNEISELLHITLIKLDFLFWLEISSSGKWCWRFKSFFFIPR